MFNLHKVYRRLLLSAGLLLLTACTMLPIQMPIPATPEPVGELQTLYVGPEPMECVGVAPMLCLLVRETPDEAYSLFYGAIEGFDFVPGFEYELLVQGEEVDDPPADASALRYTLVEIVEQTSLATVPLQGTVWLLHAYVDAQGARQPALAESDGFILLENGELGGTAGCNSFFAAYNAEGAMLDFGPVGSTMMACEEALMAQESGVVAALDATVAHYIIGDTLNLLDASGTVIAVFGESAADTPDMDEPDMDELDEEADASASAIEDVRWLLVEYADSGVLQPAVEESGAFLLLSDFDVSGNTGCNQFGGGRAYLIEGESLRFGQMVSTLMACLGPVAEQEQGVFAALEATRSYVREGDTLTLVDESGAPVLVFVADPAATLQDNVQDNVQDDDMADMAGDETVSSPTEMDDMTPALENYRWMLAAYLDRSGALAAPVAEGEMELSGGAMSGVTGCNRMNSAYTTAGDGLSFGVVATTRMGCAPDIAAQEFAVLGALRQVVDYTLADDTLTLTNADGDAVLVFVAPE